MIPESSASPFYFKENMPKSPEVSSLGTYGNFQANPYNGKANISIPLHAIEFDGVQIPITLSYDSSGVRVAQDAGWVGLNWNLSTSFGISRTIYGADDFDDTPAPNSHPSQTSIAVPENGFIYNFFDVPPPAGGGTPTLSSSEMYRIFGSFQDDGAVMPSREVDTQPDIFEANVFGNTYKFRLVKKGAGNLITARVLNNNNVEITLDLTNMSFTLVDDNGFTYNFSSKERSTTFSPIDGEQGFATTQGPGVYPGFLVELRGDQYKQDEEVITHWYVDSVTSPYGEMMNFTYADGLSFTFPSPVQNDSYETNYNGEFVTSGATNEPIGSTTVIKHKYLTQISGDFGSIDFQLGSREDLCTLDAISIFSGIDPLQLQSNGIGPLHTNGLTINNLDPDQSKKLDQMLVKDLNGVTRKTITFNTSYFNSDKLTDPVKERYLRLKLDSVDVNGQSYAFNYIDSNTLPSKDSRSIDFWGFYNGVSNTNLIPTIGRFMTGTHWTGPTLQYFLEFNGGIRKSDFNFGKRGLLNRVIYPTGGYTNFSYEPHDVVLSKTPAFSVTDSINISGTYYNKWTDMTDEDRYNFTYQYLKYANDSSYDYFNVSPPQAGNPVTVSLTHSSSFVIDFPSEVRAAGTLSMATGSNNILPSHDLYYIENILTGEKYGIINYLDGPTSSNYTVDIDKSVFLPPGNYRIRLFYDTGPVIVFTGNFTLNTYENSNLLPEDFSERFEVGGARVAKITHRDAGGNFVNAVAYDYEYMEGTDGLKSSGKLMDDLIFFSSASGQHSYNPHGYVSPSPSHNSTSTLRNSPSAQGSHIGYSFVQETQLDANCNALGRTDRHYKNHKNIYYKESWADLPITVELSGNAFNTDHVKVSNTIVLGLPPKLNFENSNGLVDSEQVFDSSGRLVQETQNEYIHLTGDRDDTYFAKFMPITGVSYHKFYEYNQVFFYQLPLNFSDQYVLSHSETYQYFEGEDIKTESERAYDPITHYIKNDKTVISDTESYSNVLYYPYDPEVSGQLAMNLLRDENRLATTIREETYHNADTIRVREYGYGNTAAVTAGNTMVTSVRTAKGSDLLETRTEIELYDAKGNVLQRRNSDGRVTSYLWGYNDRYPVAKIENATYTDVTNTGVSQTVLDNPTSDTVMRTELEKVRTGLPNAMVTTYTYEPLVGVTSTIDPRGQVTHYEYDDQNRLLTVKDNDNALLQDFSYNYADTSTIDYSLYSYDETDCGSPASTPTVGGVYLSEIVEVNTNTKTANLYGPVGAVITFRGTLDSAEHTGSITVDGVTTQLGSMPHVADVTIPAQGYVPCSISVYENQSGGPAGCTNLFLLSTSLDVFDHSKRSLIICIGSIQQQ